MSQELIDSVNNLTSQTTALLNEYKSAKSSIDAKVNQAAQSVVDAENAAEGAEDIRDEAAVHAATAETHKDTATVEANRASTEADRAYTEAERAKSEADRASQITGLDTVEDAIDLEMLNHNPYGAMSKAEYDALREQRIRENKGSGFKEWGKQQNSASGGTVNNGMFTYVNSASSANKIGMGTSSNVVAESRTDFPIVQVDGVEIEIRHTEPFNEQDLLAIKLPDAPDGTKTLNKTTGEVRKYTDRAGVGVKHEVYTPDFDGVAHIAMPTYVFDTGAQIEFKFKWDGSDSNNHQLIADSTDNSLRVSRFATSGLLNFSGFSSVTINGENTTNTALVVEQGVEYHFVGVSSVANSLNYFGSNNTGSQNWNGEIWDIKLEDPELPSGFRYYRNLVHQDASLPAHDSSVIPVEEKGSLEAGWQVNYEGDGFASVPAFPLADSMDVSVTLRTDDASIDTHFGQGSSNWLRFANLGAADIPYFQIRVGSANFAGFDALTEGAIYKCNIQIRKNADPAVDYTVSATVNGQTFTNSSVVFLLDQFEYFGIGGYGDGSAASQRWQGNIWDLKIEYPDAPDLNRHYKGIEPVDPQGRLTLIDEEGFSDKDWTPEYTLAGNGDAIHLPTWEVAGDLEYSAVVSFDGLGRTEAVGQINSANGASRRLYVGKNTRDALLFGWGSTSDSFNDAVPVVTRREYHLKMVVSGNTATCYADGVKLGTITNVFEKSWDRLYTGGTGYTSTVTNELAGTARDVRLTDLTNPENSRHYPLVINSATQPADDAPIVDELYDKATTPFYAPDSSSGYRYISVPEWSWTGNTVKFKYKHVDTGDIQVLVDGRSANNGGAEFGYFQVHSNGTFTWGASGFSVWVNGNSIVSGVFPVEDGKEYDIEISATGSNACVRSFLGRDFTTTYVCRGRLWDISLTDNTDSTNSRYYQGTVYSPDAVPTGTVLAQAMRVERVGNPSFDDGLTDWTISGNVTDNADGSVHLQDSASVYQSSVLNLQAGETYEAVISLRNIVSSASFRHCTDYIDNSWTTDGTYTFQFTVLESDTNLRAQILTSVGGSADVELISIRAVNDGTLVNFPTGAEWTLAQVDGLTEGTPENFTGSVWNNDLSSTDAALSGFTTEWEEVKFYDAELVGTTVWQPSSLQASQKAFDWAAISDAEVIISRKDFSFVEVWSENVSDKGILCRYGNTQYAGSGTPVTDVGVLQGYSAFGEWDEDTVGNVEVIANMTEAELKAFHADPTNNTWWDPEENEYYQTRYRIRTVEGLGDDWGNVYSSANPASAGDGYMHYNRYYRIHPQGANEVVNDAGKGFPVYTGFNNVQSAKSIVGAFDGIANVNTATLDQSVAIPLTLTQRLNQGATHPVYNPQGCARWQEYGVSTNYWFADWGDNECSLERAFYMCSQTGDWGANKDTGKMGASKGSGRSDQYEYYDAIYAGLVEDLRLPCTTDHNLLTDQVRKDVAGTTRGRGKVPFTTVQQQITGRSTSGRIQFELPTADHFYPAGNDYLNGTTLYVENDGNWTEVTVTDSVVAGTYVQVDFTPSVVRDPTQRVVVSWELSAEYDSLPWVDIIGDPERIAATFPDGCIGQWIGHDIPDGSSLNWNLNEKANSGTASAALQVLRTHDDGANWASSQQSWDSVKNVVYIQSDNNPVGTVSLVYYETLSDFTESDDNRAVVGDLGDVEALTFSTATWGNRLAPSLTDTILRSNSALSKVFKVTDYTLTRENGELRIGDGHGVGHAALDLIAPDNNSDAVKALPHLVEKDGLLYLQYHATQLAYGDTDWGDDSAVAIVDGESTKTDLNGNTVKVVTHTHKIPVGIA